ncbi:MAG: hypothetical protein AAB267_01840, partial [Candidatus Desantisbacteria bacterium]
MSAEGIPSEKITYSNGKEVTDHPTLDKIPPDTSITSSSITNQKKIITTTIITTYYYDCQDNPDPKQIPNPTVETSISESTFSGSAQFSWKATDNISKSENILYAYSLSSNPGHPSSKKTSHTFSNLGEGNYIFSVKARDEAGNVEENWPTESFHIELKTVNETKSITRKVKPPGCDHPDDNYDLS